MVHAARGRAERHHQETLLTVTPTLVLYRDLARSTPVWTGLAGDRTRWRIPEEDQMLAQGVTPYWRLYDLLAALGGSGRSAPQRGGLIARTLAASAVFGLVPTLLFVLWLGLEGAPGLAITQINWRMWLVVPFLPLSPALVLAWESTFLRLLTRAMAGDVEENWPLASLQEAIRRVDRLYWPVASSFTLACVGGFLWADRVQLNYTAGGAWLVVAPLIVGFLGLHVGTAVWAAAKTLIVVRVALRPVLAWNPYLARPAKAVEELSKLAYRTGVLFSLGAVFVPGLLSLLDGLSGLSRVLVYFLILLLVLGGFGIFALSTRWLNDQASRQREAALTRFAPFLAETEAWVLSRRPMDAEQSRELAARATTISALTGFIASAPAISTGALRVQRMVGTLLVPISLSVLQSLM